MVDALTFLDKIAKAKPQPIYVLFGEETFLKREVLSALDKLLLDNADPDFARTVMPGVSAEWSTVRSELDTLPFLSPKRIVVIDQADPFVTKYRQQLEKFTDQPAKNGVLILDVKSWPSNTKLAKLVPDAGTIQCKALSHQQVSRWCSERAQSIYSKRLDSDAVSWLVELVGDEMGLLDQELSKLAVYVGDRSTIHRDDVDKLVGRNRAAETFKIFDAIAAGQPKAALAILERLFEQGEEPLAILGAFSWQLRRLAKVGRLARTRRSLNEAIADAGIPPFARGQTEAQLRHLGPGRLGQVYDWLVEANLKMKSTDELPEQLLLERLVVKLCRPREDALPRVGKSTK